MHHPCLTLFTYMCVVFKVFPTRRQRPRPETRKGDEEEYYEPTARYFLLIVGMVRKKTSADIN